MKMKKKINKNKTYILYVILFLLGTISSTAWANDTAFYSLHVDKFCSAQSNEFLYLPGVAELYIPQGAIDEDLQIGMTVSFWWNSDCPDFMIEFSPHGTVFNIPVQLSISLLMSRLYFGDEIGVYYYDEYIQDWILVDIITISYPGQRVTVELEHFSVYAFSKIKNGN